jgi:hypothetical protein
LRAHPTGTRSTPRTSHPLPRQGEGGGGQALLLALTGLFIFGLPLSATRLAVAAYCSAPRRPWPHSFAWRPRPAPAAAWAALALGWRMRVVR